MKTIDQGNRFLINLEQNYQFVGNMSRNTEKGLSKYQQFFQMAHSAINKPFLHFQKFSLGEDIINMLTQSEINQFNSIELELFELCKNIKTKLPKSNGHQLRLWILKIKAISEQIQKLCKSLRISFICGLFQKVVLCFTILIYWGNNFSDVKSEQKQKQLIKPNKFYKDDSTQTVNSNGNERIRENQVQLTRVKRNRDPAYKLRMGGVSLYNESYRRNLDIKSLFADLFENNPNQKEKKSWISDMKKLLSIDNQQSQPVDITPSSDILNTILNESDPNGELRVFDHEFTTNYLPGEEFEYIVQSLGQTYISEKRKILHTIKNLFERILFSEKEKRRKLQNELRAAKDRIERISELISSEHKQKRTVFVQTMPCQQLALLISENKKFQQQLRMSKNTLSQLNKVIKQQNHDLMNFEKRIIENERKQKQLIKSMKDKEKLFEDALMKEKRRKNLLRFKMQKLRQDIAEEAEKGAKSRGIIGKLNEAKNVSSYGNSMKILSIKEEEKEEELNFSKHSHNFTRRFINTSHYIPHASKRVLNISEAKREVNNKEKLKFTKSQKFIRQSFILSKGHQKVENKIVEDLQKSDHIQSLSSCVPLSIQTRNRIASEKGEKNSDKVKLEKLSGDENKNNRHKKQGFNFKIQSKEISLFIAGKKEEQKNSPKKAPIKAPIQNVKKNVTERAHKPSKSKYFEAHSKGLEQKSLQNSRLNKSNSNKLSFQQSSTSLQKSKKRPSQILENCSSEALQFPAIPNYHMKLNRADKIKEKLKKFSNKSSLNNENVIELQNQSNVNRKSNKTGCKEKKEEQQKNAMDTIQEHSSSQINNSFTDSHPQLLHQSKNNLNSQYSLKKRVLKDQSVLSSHKLVAEEMLRQKLKAQSYLDRRKMLKACTVSAGNAKELSLSLINSFFQGQGNSK